MVSEGEEAPDFTLQADDGREVSLSDYRGKKVVLYFYPKDGTPGCSREAVEFRDMVKEFEKEDIVILGVSKDSVQNIRTQSRARLQRRDFFSTSIGRRSNPNPPTLQLFSARWLLQKSVLIRFA